MRLLPVWLFVIHLASAVPSQAQDAADAPKSPIDYAQVVEHADWRWEPSGDSSLLASMGRLVKYQAKIESQKGTPFLAITILDDGNELYSWKGHYYSVFHIEGDILFIPHYSPVGTGGELAAVDLTNGKELWRKKLKALGDISHFAYSTRVRIGFKQDAVWVWGKESFGNYVELKDPETGKAIAHKVFPRKEE